MKAGFSHNFNIQNTYINMQFIYSIHNIEEKIEKYYLSSWSYISTWDDFWYLKTYHITVLMIYLILCKGTGSL